MMSAPMFMELHMHAPCGRIKSGRGVFPIFTFKISEQQVLTLIFRVIYTHVKLRVTANISTIHSFHLYFFIYL